MQALCARGTIQSKEAKSLGLLPQCTCCFIWTHPCLFLQPYQMKH